MKTTVVANQKGGPGKTTLSVLYAHWLVDKKGARVCFIDLDSQRNASKTLAAFDASVPAASLFASADVRMPADRSRRLVLLAGGSALIDVERARPGMLLPAFVRQLEGLAECFDHCVIDTPPALGLRMSAALIAADFVACPIELEEYSIDGVTDMLRTIFGTRERYNQRLRLLGIIANRFNPHSVRQRSALAELIANYHEFVVPAKISTRSAIPEALAAGIPVWRLQKSSAREASEEVLRVFELLHGRMRCEALQEEVA